MLLRVSDRQKPTKEALSVRTDVNALPEFANFLIANSRHKYSLYTRPGITKTLLIMRLTTILILASCLHLSAATRAQQISLNETHSPLARIFDKISDQAGVLFVYRDEWLRQTRDVTISVHNAGLREVLDICFADQPFTYEIIQKLVVLKEKAPLLPQSLITDTARIPRLSLHGRITDSLGTPLAGATIRVRGTKRGANTDTKGEFDLHYLKEGDVVAISYTGYATNEITVSNTQSINVVMRRSQDILDATVIQAYGTTSRRFNVGSISTVDAATIERQPVTNVLLALQGQAPGLAVTATNGVPGSRVLLQVRGQNTLLNTPGNVKPYDQPLFILDGVPFAPQNEVISQLRNLAGNNSYSGGIDQLKGLSPFNGINPMDIESISILKDADATSIYGTQGSNGVILITTKKGKAGKTDFNLTANTGFNFAARTVHLMNTQQYLQMRKDAFDADGATPSSDPNDDFYAPDLTIFDQNKYTDWAKTIYGKTSHNTDIHASLSGGNVNNTFLVSAGYTRSDFNFPGNGYADQRLTLHSNLHHLSTDQRFSLDLGMDYGYDQNNSPVFGGGQDVLLPPNMPDLLDPAGKLVWDYQGVDLTDYQFYGYLKTFSRSQNYNLNDVLRASYKIFTGLTFTANVGYSRNTTSEHAENPAASQNPATAFSTAQFANNNFETINVEPQLDYNTQIGKGTLSALAGATYKKSINRSSTIEAENYANDNFLGSVNGAATVRTADGYSIYRYAAAFARLRYVYDQKYILSLTGRRDGSSNFGPGRQFGDFGSVGAGWIFSEEKAFKSTLPFISYAKLTGSYGTSGSDGIQAYQYQAYWQGINFAPGFQGVQPTAPLNLYNPIYSWALKKSLNLSMDLGFFHDRLFFNVTYYRDREGNQLGGYPLPAQDGFTSVLGNLPASIQNQGWEFSLNSTNIKTKDFTWSTSFNISFNRNKLLSFPNLASSPYASQYILGKSISEVMGYIYTGINPTTGLYQFRSSNGHDTSNPVYGTIARGGDQVPIANREVRYMGGFGNTLTYKGFSLYLFFQFSSQMAPNYLGFLYGSYYPGSQMVNLPTAALDYWKKPGDHSTLQRLSASLFSDATSAAGAFGGSSGGYSDDTYLRLKTVALSYTLPDGWLKKAHIHNCNIFANAQNLLTFTNYKVTDPEQFSDFTAVPLQRTVVFGLNFNF